MNVERETKSLEEAKFESAASEEETVTTKQWMKNMMKEIKDRTDDISEFEKTMTGMKFEMAEVKINKHEQNVRCILKDSR